MTLVAIALLAIIYLVAITVPVLVFSHIRRRLTQTSPGDKSSSAPARVSLIVPFKGTDPGFEENIRAFLDQDHPDFEVVMAMESPEDGAYVRLRSIAALYPGKIRFAFSGPGQAVVNKMANWLRGIEVSDPASRQVVFANGDIRPHRAWLRHLTRPLGEGQGVVMTTSYFFIVPEQGGIWSRLFAFLSFCGIISFLDTRAPLIGRLYGLHPHATAMGIRREVLERILPDLSRTWSRAAVDDITLGRLVTGLGYRFRFVPESVALCKYDCGLSEMAAMMKRYLLFARFYCPANYWFGFLVPAFITLALVTGIGLLATAPSWAGFRALCGGLLVLLLPLLVTVLYFQRMSEIVRQGLPHLPELDRAVRLARAFPWMMPLGLATSFVLYLATLSSRTFVWREKRFRIEGPLEVIRLDASAREPGRVRGLEQQSEAFPEETSRTGSEPSHT